MFKSYPIRFIIIMHGPRIYKSSMYNSSLYLYKLWSTHQSSIYINRKPREYLYKSSIYKKNDSIKVHHRSLNLFSCVIQVIKLTNRPFISSNLFSCIIPVSKLRNHSFKSSNSFNSVIPILNLVLSLIKVKTGRSKNSILTSNS